MTTSVLKAGMKIPSLQRLTLSRPMNQSGEGTIFVITDIWEIIVETMILISHRQTMLWLASTKTLVEVFPTPCTIGGAKMESKKLRLLDAWSRAWSGQSLRPQYDEFLFWLYKRVFFYSCIFSWLWVYSFQWNDDNNQTDLRASRLHKLPNALVNLGAKWEEREGLTVGITLDIGANILVEIFQDISEKLTRISF